MMLNHKLIISQAWDWRQASHLDQQFQICHYGLPARRRGGGFEDMFIDISVIRVHQPGAGAAKKTAPKQLGARVVA